VHTPTQSPAESVFLSMSGGGGFFWGMSVFLAVSYALRGGVTDLYDPWASVGVSPSGMRVQSSGCCYIEIGLRLFFVCSRRAYPIFPLSSSCERVAER